MTAEAQRRESARQSTLADLWDRYAEAQEVATPGRTSSNLEWILGPRDNRFQHAAGLDARMMDLLGLWLDNLAAEIDEPVLLIAGGSPHRAEALSLAERLRAATKAFLVAFRRP